MLADKITIMKPIVSDCHVQTHAHLGLSLDQTQVSSTPRAHSDKRYEVKCCKREGAYEHIPEKGRSRYSEVSPTAEKATLRSAKDHLLSPSTNCNRAPIAQTIPDVFEDTVRIEAGGVSCEQA